MRNSLSSLDTKTLHTLLAMRGAISVANAIPTRQRHLKILNRLKKLRTSSSTSIKQLPAEKLDTAWTASRSMGLAVNLVAAGAFASFKRPSVKSR